MKTTIILAIIKAAKIVKISPALLLALSFNESSYKNVIHPDDGIHHSYGIMQIQLPTARRFNKKITSLELMDIETNAILGAKYLKAQLKRYNGNIECALEAYNKGSAKYCEKAIYTKRVKSHMQHQVWRKWYKGKL